MQQSDVKSFSGTDINKNGTLTEKERKSNLNVSVMLDSSNDRFNFNVSSQNSRKSFSQRIISLCCPQPPINSNRRSKSWSYSNTNLYAHFGRQRSDSFGINYGGSKDYISDNSEDYGCHFGYGQYISQKTPTNCDVPTPSRNRSKQRWESNKGRDVKLCCTTIPFRFRVCPKTGVNIKSSSLLLREEKETGYFQEVGGTSTRRGTSAQFGKPWRRQVWMET